MKNEFTLVGGGSSNAPVQEKSSISSTQSITQELDIIISQGGCTIDPAY